MRVWAGAAQREAWSSLCGERESLGCPDSSLSIFPCTRNAHIPHGPYWCFYRHQQHLHTASGSFWMFVWVWYLVWWCLFGSKLKKLMASPFVSWVKAEYKEFMPCWEWEAFLKVSFCFCITAISWVLFLFSFSQLAPLSVLPELQGPQGPAFTYWLCGLFSSF